MTTFTIKSIHGTILFEGEDESLRKVVEKAVCAGADLTGADLTGADLRGADLTGADLRGADLTGADLTGAYLRGAYLTGADLTGADLRGADLRGAYLTGADLDETTQFSPLAIVPDTGSFTGWKKAQTKGGNPVIIRLLIPADAQRVNSFGRKCRAELARVDAMFLNGEPFDGIAYSKHNNSFEYRIGDDVHPDKFDPDFRVECSHGIHFFITRKEAESY